CRWRLGHAGWLVLVEVALYCPTRLEGDLPPHHVAHSFHDRPLSLVDSPAWIDDLAADIADDPHLVDGDAAVRIYRDLGDVGEVTAVAVLEGHAHGRALRELPPTPPRSVAHRFKHASHPCGLKAVPPIARRRHGLSFEQIEPELQWVLADRQRDLVEERLEYERERVASRRAHGAGRGSERHQRRLEVEVGDEPRGELDRIDVGGIDEPLDAALVLAVAHEMVAPRDQTP